MYRNNNMLHMILNYTIIFHPERTNSIMTVAKLLLLDVDFIGLENDNAPMFTNNEPIQRGKTPHKYIITNSRREVIVK